MHLNPKVEDDTENGEMSEGSTADGESSEDDGGEGLLGGLMALGMMVATRGKVKPKVGKAALGNVPKITGKAKLSTKLPSKNKLELGTSEHKQQRWEDYQARNGKWEYDRWSKQYDTNMANVKRGLEREKLYREKLGGKSKMLKTPITYRQVDISKGRELIQLKTGKVFLTKQAKLDIQKDYILTKRGYKVEYVLEKGASKPFLKALEENNISYKIGPQL